MSNYNVGINAKFKKNKKTSCKGLYLLKQRKFDFISSDLVPVQQ